MPLRIAAHRYCPAAWHALCSKFLALALTHCPWGGNARGKKGISADQHLPYGKAVQPSAYTLSSAAGHCSDGPLSCSAASPLTDHLAQLLLGLFAARVLLLKLIMPVVLQQKVCSLGSALTT